MADNFRAWDIKLNQFNRLKLEEEKIKFLLEFAIRAPSTHNSQPWLFKLGDSSCDIYLNPEKRLPKADPTERDIFISLGCCIENLIIVSGYYGVLKQVKFYNKNSKNLVAKIVFDFLSPRKEIKSLKGLVTAITYRSNSRGLFNSKKIESRIINRIKKILGGFDLKIHCIDDRETIVKLAGYTAKGLLMAHSDKEFRKEMADWIIGNNSSRLEGIPTYSMKVPNIISPIFPLLIKQINLGKILSRLNFKSIASAPLVCVITAKKNSSRNWLKVGQLAESVMLELNKNNIKTSIYLASVEMDGLYRKVMNVLGTTYKPQFVFCAGYMDEKFKPTPRIPLEEKIL